MRPPAALIIELAHGAMSTHILGALARLDIAEHLPAADLIGSVSGQRRRVGHEIRARPAHHARA